MILTTSFVGIAKAATVDASTSGGFCEDKSIDQVQDYIKANPQYKLTPVEGNKLFSYGHILMTPAFVAELEAIAMDTNNPPDQADSSDQDVTDYSSVYQLPATSYPMHLRYSVGSS